MRAFADHAVDPPIRGFLHLPETSNGSGLVLTHGAGGNAQAPLLVALAEAFSAGGFMVLRYDLPYRQARRYGPPGPGDATRDRAGLKNAVAAIKKILDGPTYAASQGRGPIFLAGHSYGGRQSSMLCAEQPDLVGGLLLCSYPLHPPRRPEQQRTQHLPDLRTPTLFVHGTRDPFGSIGELEGAIKMIPARTKLLPIEDAGHDLGFKGIAKQEGLPNNVLSEFLRFFSES
jgi:uncharacterized protein